MKGWLIAAAWWSGVAYVLGNAIFALWNPQAWMRAAWTARRGFDPGAESEGDVRCMGVFFAIVGLGMGYLAAKLTLRLIS
jgi:hypothetical protein